MNSHRSPSTTKLCLGTTKEILAPVDHPQVDFRHFFWGGVSTGLLRAKQKLHSFELTVRPLKKWWFPSLRISKLPGRYESGDMLVAGRVNHNLEEFHNFTSSLASNTGRCKVFKVLPPERPERGVVICGRVLLPPHEFAQLWNKTRKFRWRMWGTQKIEKTLLVDFLGGPCWWYGLIRGATIELIQNGSAGGRLSWSDDSSTKTIPGYQLKGNPSESHRSASCLLIFCKILMEEIHLGCIKHCK